MEADSSLSESIRIVNAVEAGTLSKYFLFEIQTRVGAPAVLRRFSEFDWLRQALLVEFPCVFVPPLPPKLPRSLWPENYLDVRKRELARFINRISAEAHFSASQALQLFLNEGERDSFSSGRKLLMSALKARTTAATTEVLRTGFPDLPAAAPLEELREHALADVDRQKLARLTWFVGEEYAKLKTAMHAAEKLHESLEIAAEHAREFAEQFRTLTAHETDVGAPPSPLRRCDVANPLSRAQNGLHLRFLDKGVIASIRAELADIEAFIEVVRERDMTVSKCKAAVERAARWHREQGCLASELDRRERELADERDFLALRAAVVPVVEAEFVRVWQFTQNNQLRAESALALAETEHHRIGTRAWRGLAEQARENHESEAELLAEIQRDAGESPDAEEAADADVDGDDAEEPAAAL